MIVCYADGGGLGHLTRVRAYRVVHLARLLRWDAYRPLLLPSAPPRFAETRLAEPVTAEHLAYLREISSTARL
jgi:hypothetical protein